MTLTDYARIGARTRFTEIAQEMRTIQKQFPGIERDVREATGTSYKAAGQTRQVVKTRRKMSAKARAAISAAQKARWAAQRAAAPATEDTEAAPRKGSKRTGRKK